MSLLSPNLQAFMAIIETSTVHGAATKIGLTQTGVTQRIRSLERALGTTLFIRTRKGMMLTEEGQVLQQYCIKALELEGETLAGLFATQKEHQVRVSITAPSSLMRSRVIPQTSSVLKSFPNLLISYHVLDNQSGVTQLKLGQAQLAIIPTHEVANEFDTKKLSPEQYILVGPYGWKNWPIKDIIENQRIIDFNQKDDLTFNYLKRFRLYHLLQKKQPQRHFANNTDALTSLIINGHGYSVLANNFAESFLQSKQLVELNPGKSLPVDFALAWYPRPNMPKYLEGLIASLK